MAHMAAACAFLATIPDIAKEVVSSAGVVLAGAAFDHPKTLERLTMQQNEYVASIRNIYKTPNFRNVR